MRQAVTRTRDSLGERIDGVLALTRTVDESALEELEMSLIASDIGVNTAAEITNNLRERAKRQQIRDGAELKELLKEELQVILDENAQPAKVVANGPEVIMMVGVNGTGKTTTSGKLAAFYRSQGKTALLCAADTFRAAAIEQLEVWSERSGVEMVKTKQGGDPSAVLFDALQAAQTRRTDVVIVDTAGRLHTKTGLMAELDKMRRTAQRIIPDAPHEVLLVLDATTGQNGLQQARLFTESAGVTGIVLTKLDGTAKGGIAVAIAREMRLPVRFVGVGEALEDLLPFDSGAFVNSLLEN
jgi:fused signal recognition particle receptor